MARRFSCYTERSREAAKSRDLHFARGGLLFGTNRRFLVGLNASSDDNKEGWFIGTAEAVP
jgi:hypothetical protein